MSRYSSLFCFAFAGFAAVALSGCTEVSKKRPPMGKVKGTVTYKGKPVSGAAVTFMMDGSPRTASGQTDAEGHFKLTTYDMNDGAAVGMHKVTVAKPKTAAAGKSPADLKPDDLAKMSNSGQLKTAPTDELPEKYADMKTTPLKYTVDPGENDKKIDLD